MKRGRWAVVFSGGGSALVVLTVLGANSCGDDGVPAPGGGDSTTVEAALLDATASSDSGSQPDDAASDADALDPLCAEFAAAGCSSEILFKCGGYLTCSSVRTDLARRAYRCTLDSRIPCGPGTDSDWCTEQVTAEHLRDPPFADYRRRCLERYAECHEAGTPFFDALCGPPDGDPTHAWYRDAVYEQLTTCLSGSCEAELECFRAAIACR